LVGAKKRAAQKWTNQGLRLPSSVLPYADGWEEGSSLGFRACSLSLDYEVEQRVLGLEDFFAYDKADRCAFELAKYLSEEEAEKERKREEIQECREISIFREYEKCLTKRATHRLKGK
jgi:hypothetical protein